MLGYVCQYNHEHHYDIAPQVEDILDFIAQSTATDGMLSTKSLFKLSTGSTKLRPYFKQFESNGVFTKIIRKILLPNSAYKISLYKNDNNEYAAFWLIGLTIYLISKLTQAASILQIWTNLSQCVTK